mmetsp:Transcript_140616/g.244841  ORF Transcript_140616/g.244841 Transcript_140616/m.244841 type:complete len:251 (+) Transcript_140616:228-980(+)
MSICIIYDQITVALHTQNVGSGTLVRCVAGPSCMPMLVQDEVPVTLHDEVVRAIVQLWDLGIGKKFRLLGVGGPVDVTTAIAQLDVPIPLHLQPGVAEKRVSAPNDKPSRVIRSQIPVALQNESIWTMPLAFRSAGPNRFILPSLKLVQNYVPVVLHDEMVGPILQVPDISDTGLRDSAHGRGCGGGGWCGGHGCWEPVKSAHGNGYGGFDGGRCGDWTELHWLLLTSSIHQLRYHLLPKLLFSLCLLFS